MFVKSKLFTNKKILSALLCAFMLVPTGQMQAFSWNDSIATPIKTAVKNFKAPTWQNSKWMIATFALTAIALIFYNTSKTPNFYMANTVKKILYNIGMPACLLALYASSPIAFNVKWLHLLLMVSINGDSIASFLPKKYFEKNKKKYGEKERQKTEEKLDAKIVEKPKIKDTKEVIVVSGEKQDQEKKDSGKNKKKEQEPKEKEKTQKIE